MKYKLNKILNNRKTLYFVLSIVLVSVFTLTIAYAALNTVLKITGNAEVVASNWDIYLDNIQLVSDSATSTKPTITNKTTASFTTTLTNPGDYYMFTIDVVNNGTIDAMIDSIEKTPTLTESQSKYLNYIVEYQNGESINTKQLVEKNSFVRLKVKVEFRKDLTASDLPTTTETLNLSFTVKFSQADESGTSSVENSGKLIKVVSGDYDTVGSEICINSECFYVISSTENDVTMLAKYNLHVGYKYDDINYNVLLENPIGKQDSSAIGWFEGYSVSNPIIGTNRFSENGYWSSSVSSYPAYVFNENSNLYQYVENYNVYLEAIDLNLKEVRLITYEELEELGCSGNDKSCSEAPSFVYSTSYWTGSAGSTKSVWDVNKKSEFSNNNYTSVRLGCRPVVVISKSEF